MNDKKRRSVREWFEDLDRKLHHADEKAQAASDRLERRMEDKAKAMEDSMERFGTEDGRQGEGRRIFHGALRAENRR